MTLEELRALDLAVAEAVDPERAWAWRECGDYWHSTDAAFQILKGHREPTCPICGGTIDEDMLAKYNNDTDVILEVPTVERIKIPIRLSTYSSSAWMLMERLSRKYEVHTWIGVEGKCYAYLSGDPAKIQTYPAVANTLPEALCRAVLAAMGKETA